MRKTNKCPYSKNVICEYVDSETEYQCCDCPHYFPPRKEEPIDGRKTIGCLIVGIAIMAAVLGIIAWTIHLMRP